MKQGKPLAGVRVLDLSRWIAGPHAAMMLGDMGADVVKVESPSGDPSRLSGPHIKGESAYFMALNRSKRGITVDLRSDQGKHKLRELARSADILIENFRPGVLARLGLDTETVKDLNPQLIVVSVSGYGQDGPWAGRGVFDSVAQAVSGLQAVTGHADGGPVKSGFYLGDYAAALHATIGAISALYARAKTGVGEHIDISLVESLLSLSSSMVPGYFGAGVIPERQGNRNLHAAPADVFPTMDGYVQISASTTNLFRKLVLVMGKDYLLQDSRFTSNQNRVDNSHDLWDEITNWTSSLPSKDVEDMAAKAGVPAGIVASMKDVAQNEQLEYRKFFQSLAHPVAGNVKFAGPVVRFCNNPLTVERASPLLGEHNAEVSSDWLGEDTDEDHSQADSVASHHARVPTSITEETSG